MPRRCQLDRPQRRSRRNLLSTLPLPVQTGHSVADGANPMDITRSRTQPNVFARHLFAPLAGRYDRLAEILSMGQNRRWRKAMVEHITGANAGLVLDVACGPARVSRAIAEKTDAHIIGLDL